MDKAEEVWQALLCLERQSVAQGSPTALKSEMARLHQKYRDLRISTGPTTSVQDVTL